MLMWEMIIMRYWREEEEMLSAPINQAPGPNANGSMLVLDVEKECDKAANEAIGRRFQFSEYWDVSPEMLESKVSDKEAKKVEEEQNKEKEEGSVPLQAVENTGLALYI